ncbi:MAG: glycosyltransferase [Desulfobulbaceae bacterium]|nr:glycosyltransferase [Desulfobulbaceae bacterium]
MRGWFGISSLESLAQGKPVIAGLDDWNIRCIKEFTGADELLWQVARNGEQLKEILADLIADPGKRLTIGKQSRAFMERHWTEQQALAVLLNVYEEL